MGHGFVNSHTTGARHYSFLRHRMQPLLVAALATVLLSGCDWMAISSVNTRGEASNNASGLPSLSADGRVMAFVSTATNLDPTITVTGADPVHVYAHDARLGKTVLVSANRAGIEGNGYSIYPRVSGNGRYIAYASAADNLVPDDNNGVYDIFVYDRKTRHNTRISPTTRDGKNAVFNSAPTISGDGRYVAYFSRTSSPDAICCPDGNIVVFDRKTGVTSALHVLGEDSGIRYWKFNPSISGDGRFVAFEHRRDVSGLPTDIVVHDRNTGITGRVSVSSVGEAANGSSAYPAISADGRYVAFVSIATNLVEGDNNGTSDIFVHDRVTGATTRANVDSQGAEANQYSQTPGISGDGRYISFNSAASNLVEGDSNGVVDAFVHDRHRGTTRRVSISPTGVEGNGETYEYVALSADGHYASFASEANNLVANDSNGVADVFLRAVPHVTVTSVVPDHLPTGSTTSITVTGTDFLKGAKPLLGALLSNVVIVDENTLTMDVTVPVHAPPGARTLLVTLGGNGPGELSGSTGRCQDCVTFF